MDELKPGPAACELSVAFYPWECVTAFFLVIQLQKTNGLYETTTTIACERPFPPSELTPCLSMKWAREIHWCTEVLQVSFHPFLRNLHILRLLFLSPQRLWMFVGI